MGADFNTLKIGEFNPHQRGVIATSTSAVTNRKLGANARGFDEAVIDCKMPSGTCTSVVFEVMYWSDQSAAFVLAVPTEELTFTAGVGQGRISPRGRTFYLRCKTITGGASPKFDLDLAGISVDSGQ